MTTASRALDDAVRNVLLNSWDPLSADRDDAYDAALPTIITALASSPGVEEVERLLERLEEEVFRAEADPEDREIAAAELVDLREAQSDWPGP